MIDPTILGKTPPIQHNSAFAENKKEPRGDLPDFDKLLEQSNAEMREQRNKEAAATEDGILRIGETKSDKEFRETLEKITGKKQEKLKNKLDKDDYIHLMVTQMRYQDPTKPLDNQEMATQLAQFNTVEQLVSIHKLLNQMNASQTESRFDKLTQYLGATVEANLNKILIKDNQKLPAVFFELPSNASTVSVQIKDFTGKVVRTYALGSQEAGKHKIPWDGKDDKGEMLPKGEYTFTVDATTSDGKPVAAKISTLTRVDGITNLSEGGKLETPLGTLELKQVVAVRHPEWENQLTHQNHSQS